MSYRFQLPDGQIVMIDRPFTYDGVNYPAEWLRQMPVEERQAFGAEELPEPPAPPEAPQVPYVPQVVTPRQARIALLAAGHLDAVEAAIAAAPRAVQIDWEYAIEIRRDNPVIAAMAATIGLTEAQIDALFIAAAAPKGVGRSAIPYIGDGRAGSHGQYLRQGDGRYGLSRGWHHRIFVGKW
jgi:hypothetical protein